MKYKVIYHDTVECSVEVEAESQDQVIEKFEYGETIMGTEKENELLIDREVIEATIK